jgi:hypothetical protein
MPVNYRFDCAMLPPGAAQLWEIPDSLWNLRITGGFYGHSMQEAQGA